MNSLVLSRKLFLLLAFLCGFILLGAFFVQYKLLVEPCVLCLLQRWVFYSVICFSLAGAVVYKYRLLVLVISFFIVLAGIAGVLLAGRQVWLQTLPSVMSQKCVMGLEQLLVGQYSFWETIERAIISAPAECARVTIRILGVSLAGWSLAVFVLVVIVGGYVCARVAKAKLH